MARLTAITIANFKAIREPVRIELKPITLLFGANSVGKSTVIQALHYAYEVLVNGNFSPHQTTLGGDKIDFGGFYNIIHSRHNEEPKKYIDFSLEFSLNSENKEFRNTIPLENTSGKYILSQHGGILEHLENLAKTLEIQVCIGNSYSIMRSEKNEKNLTLITFRVNINQNFFLELDMDAFGIQIISINPDHPAFSSLSEEERDREFNSYKQSIEFHEMPEGFIATELDYRIDLPDLSFTSSRMIFPSEIINLIAILSKRIAENTLKSILYLGPLRDIPRRNFQPSQVSKKSRWAGGLAAWDKVFHAPKEFVEQVNCWLADQSRLNTGYRINRLEYLEVDKKKISNSPVDWAAEFLEQWKSQEFDDERFQEPYGNDRFEPTYDFLQDLVELQEYVNTLTTRIRISLLNLDNPRKELQPNDIGVGISQIFPVVVIAVNQDVSLAMIEQPELHIHPAIQVELGDLFIANAISQSSNDNRCFLIETHSEHLLLRLLRRVRNSTESELPEHLPTVSPKDINILYLEKADGETKIHKLEINEEGDSSGVWPHGFFEERRRELY